MINLSTPPPMEVRIGEEEAGWACGICKHVFLQGGLDFCRKEAEVHCTLVCVQCGLGLGRPRPDGICLKCRHEAMRAEELKFFAEATRVPIEEVKGWVVAPFTDVYFSSMEEFEAKRHTLVEPVEFLWLCTARSFSFEGVANSIIDAELEEHYPGAEVSLAERQFLQGLLDIFAEHRGITSWERDYTRVVILDKPVLGTPAEPTSDVATPS